MSSGTGEILSTSIIRFYVLVSSGLVLSGLDLYIEYAFYDHLPAWIMPESYLQKNHAGILSTKESCWNLIYKRIMLESYLQKNHAGIVSTKESCWNLIYKRIMLESYLQKNHAGILSTKESCWNLIYKRIMLESYLQKNQNAGSVWFDL